MRQPPRGRFRLCARQGFRASADPNPLQFGIGDGLFGLVWRNSATSSGLLMTNRVAPATTFWPRLTPIFADRPETRAALSMRVLSASLWTSNGSGLSNYQIASPIITINITAAITPRGLSRQPRPATPAPCWSMPRLRECGTVGAGVSDIVLNPRNLKSLKPGGMRITIPPEICRSPTGSASPLYMARRISLGSDGLRN